MDHRIASAVLVITAALAGCGGDGGGQDGQDQTDGTLQITYSPNPIAFSTWQDWSGRQAYVTATVRPVPAELPHVYVLDSGAVFVAGTVAITGVGSGSSSASFRAGLPINNGLAPGAYQGTLTVKICRDADCTQPYALSQSTLPYDITVLPVTAGLPPLIADVKIDGALVADTNPGLSGDVRTYSVTMVSGHTVELEPSLPFLTVSAYVDSSVVLTMLAPSQPGGIRATVAFSSQSAATTGYAVLTGRADGGRTVRLTVNLTR